ncbi:MYCBP-associated protein isoform X3 [Onychostruthus taczanowskii]|uniref:MYCBP-associated protein isoform X3 n=1 Tax=Onychostruthus taczanowskii TaxID=356909 RepID=UPI001B806470|nr:MYCBP-associated protein isoform X3 [Onychostruthus taczanowskii]
MRMARPARLSGAAERQQGAVRRAACRSLSLPVAACRSLSLPVAACGGAGPGAGGRDMASRRGSRSRNRSPPGKKEKSFERLSLTIEEPEPEPVPYVLQRQDFQALEIKEEDLEKLHAPRLAYGAGRIPVRRNYLVRKYRPKEVAHLVAHPVPPKAPRGPLTFPGPRQFDDGCEEILPHHILGSLQELRMEALAKRNTQLADAIKVPHPDVTAAALEEDHGEEKKEKSHQAQLAEHKAFQNWSHHMAMRKKQEKHLGEILHKPENELLMNMSDNYRQIQEERDLIDRSLPALFPGKGYRVGSEFWSLPEQIGDDLTGLTLTLTRTERGHPEPLTHVGKPRTIQRETGLKPPKKIPYHVNWDKSLFLKHRRQELKSLLEELGFYKPDLEGLEVIGKGQPFTSVSAEAFLHTTISEEIEILSDPLGDSFTVVPEAEKVPSLVFCGQPARWIKGITACREEIGIAARLTFETLASEKAESFLTVTNDGIASIWYNWMRLPQQIPSRETKGRRGPCFYFDTRPGVILPGETRTFSFIFKSERAGIFSEPWEFRTHPLLLGGALLQVTLWGIAVYEDKLADFREKLENELAAREGASIVKESLNELLDQIRTPECTPSPVDACVTEEELFHRKNPELHYQHQVIKQLHKLWRQHLTVPSGLEEEVPLDQRSTAEGMEYHGSTLEPPSVQSSTTESPHGKHALQDAPREKSIEEEEAGPSGWNLSIEDFKQAIMSISGEEQREEALTQLNKAALELCVEQRPTQSDLLYPLCLQLWRGAIDDLVCHSLRLRSVLGLIKKDAYAETEEVKQGGAKKGGREDKIFAKKEEKKDKEGKKSRGTSGKEKVDHSGSRKLKGSISVHDMKGGAESIKGRGEKQKVKEEAATTVGAEPVQEDSILLARYREKLYIEVSLTKACIIVLVLFFSCKAH